MINIRCATSEDSLALTEIALAAKRVWGYPESLIEIWRRDLTITPDFIRKNEVYAAIEQDRPVGFYALIFSADKTELDHLWVLPELIGKGLGRQLLEHAIGRVAANGGRNLEIVSDPNAVGFYLKAGAKRIGEFISETVGGERRLPRLKIEIQS